MIFPVWALFGSASAVLSATMLLVQERFKVNGYVMAVWCKIVCATVLIPFVIVQGLPPDPLFYAYVCSGAVIWAVSDVIFFNSISKAGGGTISRLIPTSVIFSFLLWFVFDPGLLDKYFAMPVRSGLIFLVLCLFALFAAQLKKCEVSMRALRLVWFVLLAAVIGPVLTKKATLHAALAKGPASYVFVEAVTMLSLWLVYYVVKKPVSRAAFFARPAWTGGIIVGSAMVCMVLLDIMAYYYVDNPAYISALNLLDSVLILLFYRFIKHKDKGNIRAGLGVVACAVALIILKAGV